MAEIDTCDLLGFLRIRAWHASREKSKPVPKQGYIDSVWPALKP